MDDAEGFKRALLIIGLVLMLALLAADVACGVSTPFHASHRAFCERPAYPTPPSA